MLKNKLIEKYVEEFAFETWDTVKVVLEATFADAEVEYGKSYFFNLKEEMN